MGFLISINIGILTFSITFLIMGPTRRHRYKYTHRQNIYTQTHKHTNICKHTQKIQSILVNHGTWNTKIFPPFLTLSIAIIQKFNPIFIHYYEHVLKVKNVLLLSNILYFLNFLSYKTFSLVSFSVNKLDNFIAYNFLQ